MQGGGARPQSSWQRIKHHPIVTGVIIVASVSVVALIVVIILGYRLGWDWSGLGSYTLPGKNGIFQREKTLWDWLQLLIIPFVLVVGGYVFNATISRNGQKAAASRDQTERGIAQDNQREGALQEYINTMAELLLHENLRGSVEDDEVRKIARVRTLTALSRLNADRKKCLLQFLYEAGLIYKDRCIVDLSGADLHGVEMDLANLHGANLSYADLRGVDLTRSDLVGANLHGANLSHATLREAALSYADLSYADLSYATLSYANLYTTNLNLANLHGTDLHGAYLRGAKVATEQLIQVKSFAGTTMPDGTTHS